MYPTPGHLAEAARGDIARARNARLLDGSEGARESSNAATPPLQIS
jgi:hypothetical protein